MKNLKIIRNKRNINQVRLAMEIGVTQETISAYESGKALPSADTLIKMAKLLHTNIDYLLDLIDFDLPINEIDTDISNYSYFSLLSAKDKKTAEMIAKFVSQQKYEE